MQNMLCSADVASIVGISAPSVWTHCHITVDLFSFLVLLSIFLKTKLFENLYSSRTIDEKERKNLKKKT